eukprot:gene22713-24502_t
MEQVFQPSSETVPAEGGQEAQDVAEAAPAEAADP